MGQNEAVLLDRASKARVKSLAAKERAASESNNAESANFQRKNILLED